MSNESRSLIDAIDALLPQTQCARCGFAGCRPYAAALARAETALNRCPPGGAATIGRLAALLQQPVLALDPACGEQRLLSVAWIDAERCIGCARCLPPCPTDAIVGAQRLLHTVVVELCTGCELCLPSCPVDCIVMQVRCAADGPEPTANDNRTRFASHQHRLAERDAARDALLDARKQVPAPPT